jgi:DNA mismatch repair protein MutL
MEIDPEQIDINIHPTKTEIKFRDERAVYAILLAAVRRALGRHNISPSLDFDQEQSINITPLRAGQDVQMPALKVNHDYNPFGAEVHKKDVLSGWFDAKEKRESNWQDLMQVGRDIKPSTQEKYLEHTATLEQERQEQTKLQWEDDAPTFQVHRKYIAQASRSGLLLIDQQRAHQRVLFEKFYDQMESGSGYSQQLLFPETITLSPSDFVMLQSIMTDVHALGFELEEFGGSTYKVNGTPADVAVGDVQRMLENFIEQLKNERNTLQYTAREKTAWALARTASIRHGQMLTQPEMNELVQQLFNCKVPYAAENNRTTVVTLSLNQLEQQFK